MQAMDIDALALECFRDEQLGRFQSALDGYRRILNAQPHHLFAATRLFKLQRDLRSDPPARSTIVWQIALDNAWESEWVRYVLSGLECAEIVDGRHAQFVDGAIVVDHHLDQRKLDYYFEMLKRGNRFAIVHVSDEHYSDNCTPYAFANFAIRNYWSRAHAADANVLSLPLGMMDGFRANAAKTTRERRYIWCFAGNISKSSRVEMMQAMMRVERGYSRHTNAVGAGRSEAEAARDPNAPLTIAQYAQIMSDAVFAPCPAGWENLDSFRVCEALEAGCIPIVERRPWFDYFLHLFGNHPMITVSSWTDAPKLIAELTSDAAALDARRLECVAWWRDHKATLVSRIRDEITRALSRRLIR